MRETSSPHTRRSRCTRGQLLACSQAGTPRHRIRHEVEGSGSEPESVGALSYDILVLWKVLWHNFKREEQAQSLSSVKSLEQGCPSSAYCLNLRHYASHPPLGSEP